MNENDKKVKEMLEREEIPQELEPENIKKMLEEKAPQKKRSKIKMATRVTAMAAACALVCGTAVYVGQKGDLFGKDRSSNMASRDDDSHSVIKGKKSDDNKHDNKKDHKEDPTEAPTESLLNTANDYDDVYALLKRVGDKYSETTKQYDSLPTGAVMEKADGEAAVNDEDNASGATQGSYGGKGGDSNDHYETYNQEENVLESDIVKTDGEYIYRLSNNYDYDYYKSENNPTINVARVEDGKFVSSSMIEIEGEKRIEKIRTPETDVEDEQAENYSCYVNPQGMYLYNDMLVVVVSISENYWSGDYYDNENTIEVLLYTTGLEPQFIGSYSQDGYYSDVRISPDGYLYLVSSFSSMLYDEVDSADDIDDYVPAWYGDDGEKEFISADCITIPDEEPYPNPCLTYTVVGSVDLNNNTECVHTDTKAFAGYTGTVYCSADNMYTTCGWEETEITRLALDEGIITPAASGKVDGYVNDQFAMSEYNGYFRIAVTDIKESWVQNALYDFFYIDYSATSNSLYVLDMDMNEVGNVKGYGRGESIKSVNFNGDMAYVVTYEQTDPLFSIDLTDPANPTIVNELKALGFSTYMQKWDDTHLLGFGIEADEDGMQTGYKLTMYDNSDPTNVVPVGEYVIPYENDMDDNENSYTYNSSAAAYDRKALMIAPNKNVIGVPVKTYTYISSYDEQDEYYDSDYFYKGSYMYFSFDGDGFTLLGTVENESSDSLDDLNRAVYIGNYAYAVSDDVMISCDMDNFTEIDRVEF